MVLRPRLGRRGARLRQTQLGDDLLLLLADPGQQVEPVGEALHAARVEQRADRRQWPARPVDRGGEVGEPVLGGADPGSGPVEDVVGGSGGAIGLLEAHLGAVVGLDRTGEVGPKLVHPGAQVGQLRVECGHQRFGGLRARRRARVGRGHGRGGSTPEHQGRDEDDSQAAHRCQHAPGCARREPRWPKPVPQGRPAPNRLVR